MYGLLDRASLNDRWFEQTSASPAIFNVMLVNPKEASDARVTITKADKCRYVTKFELSKTEIAEFSTDLSGLDVDELGPGNSIESRNLSGAAVECKSETGDRLCKSFHDGDVPSLMPVPKDRFKQLATEFKAKYCS